MNGKFAVVSHYLFTYEPHHQMQI